MRFILFDCALVTYGERSSLPQNMIPTLRKLLVNELGIKATWPSHNRSCQIRRYIRSDQKNVHLEVRNKKAVFDKLNNVARDAIVGSNGYLLNQTPKDQTLTSQTLSRTQRTSDRIEMFLHFISLDLLHRKVTVK